MFIIIIHKVFLLINYFYRLVFKRDMIDYTLDGQVKKMIRARVLSILWS